MGVGSIKIHKIKIKVDHSVMLKDIADDMVMELKLTSPLDTGEYAKGWAVKHVDGFVVVYNEKHWRRVHLLEYGHLVRTKRGFKRVSPQPHVYPAFQKTLRNFKSYKPKIKY